MDVLASIFGIGAAIIVALLIGFAVFVAIFLSKLKKALKEAQTTTTPNRIHLRERQDDPWLDKQKRDSVLSELKEIGFAELGRYSVDEMPDVYIIACAHKQLNLVSCLYEHPKAGAWSDMVAKFSDETSVTVSNAIRGHELEHRPGHDKVYMAKAQLTELLSTAQEHCKGKELKPAPENSSEFVELMEKAYADEMDWRNGKGGASVEEIERIAKASGKNYSAKTIEIAHEIHQERAYEKLMDTLKETLKEKGVLPTASSPEFESSIVFIHNNLGKALITKLLAESGFSDTEMRELNLDEGNYRESFSKWNEQLPVQKRFQKLAALDEPTTIDVYRSRKHSYAQQD